jgi:transketolase
MEQATKLEDRKALIEHLTEEAREMRVEDIKMLVKAGSGHPGGSLSAADVIAALYLHKMRIRPEEPDWPDRDRFVLSKGHCVPIVYVALARIGMIPKDWLGTLRKLGSPLQGHPDRVRCPGIEAATGSLGQGLSMALGMAISGQVDGAKWRVWCMVGDGECQSGHIWEAAMLAGRRGQANLTAILDYNQVQQSLKVKEILDLEPIVAKWRSFNWHVREIDGHDMGEILDALDEVELVTDRPTVIVAHTVKGKGVSWMELNPDWHGKTPDEKQGEIAIAELEGKITTEESRKRFEALKEGDS